MTTVAGYQQPQSAEQRPETAGQGSRRPRPRAARPAGTALQRDTNMPLILKPVKTRT